MEGTTGITSASIKVVVKVVVEGSLNDAEEVLRRRAGTAVGAPFFAIIRLACMLTTTSTNMY